MEKNGFFPILFTILTILTISSCAGKTYTSEDIRNEINQYPVKQLVTYNADFTTPIHERVQKAPGFIMDYLEEIDGVDYYTPYMPSQEEMDLFEEYIGYLPESYLPILEDRLIAVYFINDMMGSGMADYVVDEDNEVYTILFLNPFVLDLNLDQLVTYKENTCFIPNDDVSITISMSSEYSGLLYILIHEATHIVDYVKQVTPMIEGALAILKDWDISNVPFSESVWADYDIPYDYILLKNRGDITFYGLGGGPRIDASQAADMYEDLVASPFISIYGSKNWAEDLAEWATFYWLTEKMGCEYTIRVTTGTYYSSFDMTNRDDFGDRILSADKLGLE